MKRRSFLKKMFTSILTLFGVSGGTYYYAKEIEPHMLNVLTERLYSKKIPDTFENFKIVQFSDTHIGFHYTLDQFEKLVDKVNTQQADIVVFTGDLVDMPNKYPWNERLVTILKKINAVQKYWIYGNHDHGGYGTKIVKQTMDRGGFKLLQNNFVTIEKDGQFINLAGLDDVMLGKPNIEKTLNGANLDYFTMLLVHEPDFAEVTKSYHVDVQLSGHSHGGQIQVPFFGYIYTPIFAQKYVEGKYLVGTFPLQLYVSRGLGTTRLPYRFLCKPEFTVYHLTTSQV
jgi:predicted MPP superfamily phosphohydrolase